METACLPDRASPQLYGKDSGNKASWYQAKIPRRCGVGGRILSLLAPTPPSTHSLLVFPGRGGRGEQGRPLGQSSRRPGRYADPTPPCSLSLLALQAGLMEHCPDQPSTSLPSCSPFSHQLGVTQQLTLQSAGRLCKPIPQQEGSRGGRVVPTSRPRQVLPPSSTRDPWPMGSTGPPRSTPSL